jgi:hypothetical protein
VTPDNSGYYELRIAIIEQANKDYRNALKWHRADRIKKLEKFYRSPWGEFLTGGNGENIITRIRREVKSEFI